MRITEEARQRREREAAEALKAEARRKAMRMNREWFKENKPPLPVV